MQTLFVDVDRNKAKSFGIPLADVYQTMSASMLGSSFVNQFTAFGTNLKVKLQSEQAFRSDPVVPVALLRCATPRATWCRCRS